MLSCSLRKYSEVKMIKTDMGLSGIEQRAMGQYGAIPTDTHTVCAPGRCKPGAEKPHTSEYRRIIVIFNHLLKPTRKQLTSI